MLLGREQEEFQDDMLNNRWLEIEEGQWTRETDLHLRKK